MAQHSVKRRKLDHEASSGDDDDDASFTSFGSEEEGSFQAGRAMNGNTNRADQESGVVSETNEVFEDFDSAEHNGRHESGPAGSRSRNVHTPTVSGTKTQPFANTHTNGMFKAHLFKMQVEDLLDPMRPTSGKREASVETVLRTLNKSIEQLPPCGPVSVLEAERILIANKVAVPFSEPRPNQDVKYKFAYARPASTNVVGSFALKTANRSHDILEVDMIVTMPAHLFEEKDFLNRRYMHKRAFYLACLASGLKDLHHDDFKIRFQLFNDDPLKPILIVEPLSATEVQNQASPGRRWRIHIMPCVSADRFPADKLGPNRNCVRNTNATGAAHDANLEPTPFYNGSLRSDMVMTSYLQLLYRVKKQCPSFVDACLLGSTWLRQRGLSSSVAKGGFGNFEWTTLMALCLQGGAPGGKPILSDGYTSHQLFKATLQVLAMKDISRATLSFREGESAPKAHDGYPMLWDNERQHNLLYKMSPWSYKLLRREAKVTFSTLGDQLFDGFEATFILSVRDSLQRFDNIVRLSEHSLSVSSVVRDHIPHNRFAKLYDGLKRSFGDRVSHISITKLPLDPWDLGASRPRKTREKTVAIGLVVNPSSAKRTIDQGPSAEDKEAAAAFRTFWGDKAELRRFKDGSILETLVWEATPDRGSILEQIMRYYLHRHFGVTTIEDIQYLGDVFEKLVPSGGDLTSFDDLQSQYKQLESDLRSLQDLPLTIRQIMPADAQLRYSSIRPPAYGKSLQGTRTADVTLQFEGTSRWPDDLMAIQKTKVAFLLQLGRLLKESNPHVMTGTGLENEDRNTLNQGFLDVSYGTGTAFRLRIHHDREQTLLDRQLKDKSASPKSTEIAAIGLAEYKRNFVKSPSHTQAVSRACIRHPALSGTIRLTKKWFASHLLTNHIADEMIELLVCRTFMQPWPWTTPSSVQTAFLRTLSWISRWDWRAEPLIVDLSGTSELKHADVQALTTRFEAWRKLDPNLNRIVLFVASNVDLDGTTWTDNEPAKVVAGRMTMLAKAACAEVSAKQLQLDPVSLFSSSLSDFDFALHINTASGGTQANGKKNGTTYKNLELASSVDERKLGYNPVRAFLHDLETLYGSAVLFFHGGEEKNVIAGLWNPQTAGKKWRVNLAFSTVPIKVGGDDETRAAVNKTAMISEMARLGGDLVDRVDVYRH